MSNPYFKVCGLMMMSTVGAHLSATILTFDRDPPALQTGPIPGTYGDNVSSLFQAGIGAAGHTVRINSFQLAGWPDSDRPGEDVRIVDENFNVLWSLPGQTILGSGGTHSAFTPGITSTPGGALRIQFGPEANGVGIDNIDFDQDASPVPEPASALFGGVGLLLICVGRLPRRH